jgi:alpha-1,2-glucosyltransferase
MLYLWPYMIFFSLPILTPPIINSVTIISSHTPNSFNVFRQVATFTTATILAAGVIHCNTIVHPFTLADNRHYVFYVFRLLRRHPAIKYLAAPVYILGANIVIQALRGRKKTQKLKKGTSAAAPSTTGCSTSFVIIWIATTALSLITAPLVEPRYCIIPWIMWRLHVPRHETSIEEEKKARGSWLLNLLNRDESRLLLETFWFCCINMATGYVFLYWGFTWPQEEGKVQRFMW